MSESKSREKLTFEQQYHKIGIIKCPINDAEKSINFGARGYDHIINKEGRTKRQSQDRFRLLFGKNGLKDLEKGKFVKEETDLTKNWFVLKHKEKPIRIILERNLEENPKAEFRFLSISKKRRKKRTQKIKIPSNSSPKK